MTPNTLTSSSVKNEASSSKSIQVAYGPYCCPHQARDSTNDWSAIEQQINSIQADLVVHEIPLQTVALTRQYSCRPPPRHHPFYFRNRRSAPLQRIFRHSSPALQTKPFASSENSPKPAVSHGEYVYRICSQKMASMYSNPDRRFSEIQAIRFGVLKAEGKINLNDS